MSMRNKILLIVIIFIIVLSLAIYLVYNYRTSHMETQKINNEYKSYYNLQMLGTELVSIINRTEDINEKYGVQKDENGLYIENDNNSIKIYINFIYKDDYTTLEAEKIANDGVENFIKTYSTASFKCTDISYHDKTNNVKSLTFTETND